jgi:hypothetical protein
MGTRDDNYRFPLSENEAAAVCVHAELAAAMIRALFARQSTTCRSAKPSMIKTARSRPDLNK